MKLFVGLGNPGNPYRETRHNVGFMAVDHFADKWKIPWKSSKFNALIGEGLCEGTKVYLLKPQTYMNLSGESIRAFIDFYKIELQEMIVIYDDMDTNLGQIRLRYKGSSGGHNGVKSIISQLRTEQFNRIRVGVSRPVPGDDIIDYVLSPFKKQEAQELAGALEKVVGAMEFALTEPFDKTMAKFNG